MWVWSTFLSAGVAGEQHTDTIAQNSLGHSQEPVAVPSLWWWRVNKCNMSFFFLLKFKIRSSLSPSPGLIHAVLQHYDIHVILLKKKPKTACRKENYHALVHSVTLVVQVSCLFSGGVSAAPYHTHKLKRNQKKDYFRKGLFRCLPQRIFPVAFVYVSPPLVLL